MVSVRFSCAPAIVERTIAFPSSGSTTSVWTAVGSDTPPSVVTVLTGPGVTGADAWFGLVHPATNRVVSRKIRRIGRYFMNT